MFKKDEIGDLERRLKVGILSMGFGKRLFLSVK